MPRRKEDPAELHVNTCDSDPADSGLGGMAAVCTFPAGSQPVRRVGHERKRLGMNLLVV